MAGWMRDAASWTQVVKNSSSLDPGGRKQIRLVLCLVINMLKPQNTEGTRLFNLCRAVCVGIFGLCSVFWLQVNKWHSNWCIYILTFGLWELCAWWTALSHVRNLSLRATRNIKMFIFELASNKMSHHWGVRLLDVVGSTQRK